jgi:hypothetical protein
MFWNQRHDRFASQWPLLLLVLSIIELGRNLSKVIVEVGSVADRLARRIGRLQLISDRLLRRFLGGQVIVSGILLRAQHGEVGICISDGNAIKIAVLGRALVKAPLDFCLASLVGLVVANLVLLHDVSVQPTNGASLIQDELHI